MDMKRCKVEKTLADVTVSSELFSIVMTLLSAKYGPDIPFYDNRISVLNPSFVGRMPGVY